MIDPDSIIVSNSNNYNVIKFNQVPEFDFEVWDLTDDKEVKKYLNTIEHEIRNSFEYKSMIKYLKDNMGMDQCAFIQLTNKDSYNIKIEIHHYPFTLFDIVSIVYRKRCYYKQNLSVQMIAKEVMMLHYKLLVGLIPLSSTAHQLAHAGKLFIPVQNVFGNYQAFVDSYKDFCDPEQLDTLERIEKYSLDNYNELMNTQTILKQNLITIENTSQQYQLPDMNQMNEVMNRRIETIKNNGYKLPTLKDEQEQLKQLPEKAIVSPFFYSRKE